MAYLCYRYVIERCNLLFSFLLL